MLHKLKTWSESLHRAKGRAVWACLFSLLLHLGFAVWGACWIWELHASARDVVLVSTWASSETVEFTAPLELNSLDPNVDRREPGSSAWINPLTLEANVVAPQVESSIKANSANGSETAVNATGARGNGQGTGTGSGSGTGYFHAGREAKSFVYVLDCSMSMNHPHDSETKTRFKKMKQELVRSIASLKPDQEFFIVFFNHEAIPMPASGLVPAVGENPRRYLSWMQEVIATGDTDPTPALQIAARLRPDVIYLLTDGCFSPEANEVIRQIHLPKTVIHTLSFETKLTSKQRDGLELMRRGQMRKALLKLGEVTYRRTREVFVADEVMRQLATQNGGEYREIR